MVLKRIVKCLETHLKTTPIWEGDKPFLASLQIDSTTSSGVVFNQEGGERR
jgi:hypothetical protein